MANLKAYIEWKYSVNRKRHMHYLVTVLEKIRENIEWMNAISYFITVINFHGSNFMHSSGRFRFHTRSKIKKEKYRSMSLSQWISVYFWSNIDINKMCWSNVSTTSRRKHPKFAWITEWKDRYCPRWPFETKGALWEKLTSAPRTSEQLLMFRDTEFGYHVAFQ